jgi:DNA-binding NarL/FixJ family response regulator
MNPSIFIWLNHALWLILVAYLTISATGVNRTPRGTCWDTEVPMRVILVDDHPIVLQGLRQLFERQHDVAVMACCPDAESALTAIHRHRPDILILDLRMRGLNGLELLRRLSVEGASCPTVLLTAAINDAEVLEAVRLGVRGVILKDSKPETLVTCVRRVHAGERWFDRETLTRAVTTMLERETAVSEASQELTPREIEVVRMVAQGLRNRTIGGRLFISEGTVKVHLHNIYKKLGVDGRLALTLCAQQRGLV